MSKIEVNITTGQQSVDGNFQATDYRDLQALAVRKEGEKRLAYQAESDPLFFKWQAGEGTEQAWLDKRAEINARFA